MAGSLRMGLSVKGGRTSQMWAHFCPRGVPRTEGPGAITREGLFPAPLPTSTECGPDMSQTRRASPPHRTRPSHRRLSPARPLDILQAAVPACRSRLLQAPLPGTLRAPRPEDCAGSRPVSRGLYLVTLSKSKLPTLLPLLYLFLQYVSPTLFVYFIGFLFLLEYKLHEGRDF